MFNVSASANCDASKFKIDRMLMHLRVWNPCLQIGSFSSASKIEMLSGDRSE